MKITLKQMLELHRLQTAAHKALKQLEAEIINQSTAFRIANRDGVGSNTDLFYAAMLDGVDGAVTDVLRVQTHPVNEYLGEGVSSVREPQNVKFGYRRHYTEEEKAEVTAASADLAQHLRLLQLA